MFWSAVLQLEHLGELDAAGSSCFRFLAAAPRTFLGQTVIVEASRSGCDVGADYVAKAMPGGSTPMGAVLHTIGTSACEKLPYGFATQAVPAWLKRQGDIDEETLFCSETGRRRSPPRRLIRDGPDVDGRHDQGPPEDLRNENVNATTGALKKDLVIFSWLGHNTGAVSMYGRIFMIDTYIARLEVTPVARRS
jgi:hypothetical protein